MKGMEGYSRASIRRMMPSKLKVLMENFDRAEESESAPAMESAALAIRHFVMRNVARDHRLLSLVELDLAPRLEYAGDTANRAIQVALFGKSLAETGVTNQFSSTASWADGETFDTQWRRGGEFTLTARHDPEVDARVKRGRNL